MEEMDRAGRTLHTRRPRKEDQRKRYLGELKGETVDSLWDDIPPINSQACSLIAAFLSLAKLCSEPNQPLVDLFNAVLDPA